MKEWIEIPKELPVDGSTVWVHVAAPFYDPFLAVFDLATLTFTSVICSVVYPAYFIQSFREQ